MPYSDHTVTRFVTTHTADDEDGSNVAVLTDKLDLTPFLNGAGSRSQIFTHLAGPAISEHKLDHAGIERANALTSHVILENGVSSGITDFGPGTKIGEHRTDSIDHAVILHGSVTMTYPVNGETKSVELKAGDVFVQRGTTHSWEAGPNGVRFFTVMVHAKPIVVSGGGKELKEYW